MDELPVSLALRSFGELSARAAARSFTGDLVVREADGTEHRVVMRRGMIVDVHVAGLFDPILTELHRVGDLSDTAYVEALEALGRSQRRSGDLARDAGTSADAVTRALARQGAERMKTLRERTRDRGREAFLHAREVPSREVRCRLEALPHLRRRPNDAPSRRPSEAAYRPDVSTKRPIAPDRRALRRLAFELHPDRHPHLSKRERAAMADELRAATAAFHGL
ncbi:MAG: hypothetical protein JRH11_21530 [Deltaproteobacteria bacterium]|nr:hypothetical protein [Deltaproteobacteria bacterium]